MCGPVGWDVACDQAGDDQHDRRADRNAQIERRVEEDRRRMAAARLRRLVEHVVDPFHHRHAEYHTQVTEYGGYHHRLGKDQPDDRHGLGAQRLAYAEFGGALRDRHEHDVAYADDAGQQRPQADDPDEDVDACENHHEILVGFHRIVEPDGAFVVGGEVVFGGKAPDDALFELLHRLGGVDALDGDDGIVHFGAVGVVEQLPGGQRDVTRRTAALGVALVDADHGEYRAVELDPCPQRIGALE